MQSKIKSLLDQLNSAHAIAREAITEDYQLDYTSADSWPLEAAHIMAHHAVTVCRLETSTENETSHDGLNAHLIAVRTREAAQRAPRWWWVLMGLEVDDLPGFDVDYYDPEELADLAQTIDHRAPDDLTADQAVERWLSDREAGRA